MDTRAISRRIGSNEEIQIERGVSSTMRSIPVAISRARMLRPSLPMIRPFISSLGSSMKVTVDSMTSRRLTRWEA